MNWFKHDTDATQDAKIKKLLIRYGAVGYAIYFHCLELIAAETSETNLTFELEHDSEIIADNLHIKGTADKSGIAIVEEIMRFIVSIGLFEESEGQIFCFKLLKRLDLSMTSNVRFRAMIAEAKGDNHDAIMIPSCKPTSLQASKQEEQPREEAPARSARFVRPTLEEIEAYCKERGNKVDAQAWIDHYESNGWKVGKAAMKDWKAAVRTWEKNDFKPASAKPWDNRMGALDDRPDAWGPDKIKAMQAEQSDEPDIAFSIGDAFEEIRKRQGGV